MDRKRRNAFSAGSAPTAGHGSLPGRNASVGKRAVGYRGRVEGGSKVSRLARNLPRSEHRGVRPHFPGKGGYVHQV